MSTIRERRIEGEDEAEVLNGEKKGVKGTRWGKIYGGNPLGQTLGKTRDGK